MIYHRPQDYAERYYIPFSDVEGNEWKVSIQQPEYEGTAIALQGAEIPVEWMGRGDEDQEEVVLGSTGTIRIICREQDVQSSLLVQGNLLPKYINDRRVQVLRYSGGYWDVAWQGFIVPQTLSQDWDAAPFEIELPIASVVACMEYFPMPMTNDNCYGAFAEVTNIADMLRRIFCWSGCDIRRIITNKRIYQDFNGQLQYKNDEAVHWTQGVITSQWFYTIENGIMKPKTFKDVLETIAYPFGKIQEYSKDVAFLLRWKHDADSSEPQSPPLLYALTVWSNYENSVLASSVRFDDYARIQRLLLEAIHTEGEDNKQDKVMAPSSVSFSSESENNATIFEMSEKSIKSSLPMDVNPEGPPIYRKKIKEGLFRYVYAIDKLYVNTQFMKDFSFSYSPVYTGTFDYLNTLAFCRSVDVTTNTDEKSYAMSLPVSFGFFFNMFADGNPRRDAVCNFTVPMGIKTVATMNNIKLSVTAYDMNEKEPTPNGLAISIKDLYNNRDYAHVGTTWDWQVGTPDSHVWISVSDELMKEGNDRLLWFNELRGLDDDGLHGIQIGIKCTGNVQHWTGIAFCSVKLEYVTNKWMQREETQQGEEYWTFPERAVIASFADGITNRAQLQCEGNGEALSIGFKTRAGDNNAKFRGNIIPHNGFCDYPNYIDKQNREKIEMDAVKFEQYFDTQYFNLIGNYCVVLDGSKVYVPVAVGMNPRMNTIKLILVTTNVTT